MHKGGATNLVEASSPGKNKRAWSPIARPLLLGANKRAAADAWSCSVRWPLPYRCRAQGLARGWGCTETIRVGLSCSRT